MINIWTTSLPRRPIPREIRVSRGWNRRELEEELERRKAVLEFMVEHNIRDFKEVSNIIHTYQSKPEKVLERMEIKI